MNSHRPAVAEQRQRHHVAEEQPRLAVPPQLVHHTATSMRPLERRCGETARVTRRDKPLLLQHQKKPTINSSTSDSV